MAVAREACSQGSGVVIAGAAGVGKTRLATELISGLEAPSAGAVRVIATRSAASIPLGAFASLVPSGGGPDAQTVNAIIARLRGEQPDGQRLAFLIDDAHLLDDASAMLLHRLVVDDLAVAVVTLRSNVPCPDPVVALWKDLHCRRVDLQQLAPTEAEQLIAYALPGPVDEAATHRITNLAHGNALMLRELIRGAVDADVLRTRHGVWTWVGRLPVVPALADLVAARLSAINGGALDLLRLVAFAEPLASATVIEMRGHEQLEALLNEHLVEVDGDGMVRVVHPVYSELVRADIASPTVARLSAELALAHPKPFDDAAAELRRVVWHVDAGSIADADALLDAIGYAQLHDLPLAARLAEAAVRAGAGVATRLRLADILSNAGRLDEMDSLLAEVATDTIDDRTRVTIAAMRATTLLWLRDRPADARAVIQETLANLHDESCANELWGIRLQVAMQDGYVDEVARAVEHVLDTAAIGDEAISGALVAGVAAWLLGGEFDVAIERCEAGLEHARRSADAFPVRDLLEFGATLGRLYRGDLDGAETRFTLLRRHAAQKGDVALRFLFSQGLGRVAMLRGRCSAAVRAFSEARALVELAPNLISWNLGLLAAAHAIAGDVEAATAALDEARDLASSELFAADRARADSLISWARGERSRAAALAVDAIDWSLDHSQRLPALLCAHDAACFGAGREARARLDRICEGVPGELAPALSAHVEALARRDALLMNEAAERFADIGCWRSASDAAAAAAAEFDAAGLKARATLAIRQAREMADRAEAVAAPDPDRTRALLTAREREVATLAANGSSDRDIASVLGVSVRTVETHLHRVYTKLGIGEGRAALRAFPL
jgi:DNA-binding CsgD family transcriptional regulator